MAKGQSNFADLLLLNGELVRIEYPSSCEDELWDSLEHTMKRRDWWAPGQWDGCSASYLGHRLDRVNMGLVVGCL